MEKTTTHRYSPELKAQILKEVRDTQNMALVARTHNVAYHTVVGWVQRERKAPLKKREREKKEQEIRLRKLELENQILKELLKKTNQAWLSDLELQNHSSQRDM